MKKIVLSAACVSLMSLGMFACPSDPPPEVEPVEVKPAEVIIPPYNPTGDHADIKKAAAMGLTKDNAEAKAKEIEEALDSAIAALENDSTEE